MIKKPKISAIQLALLGAGSGLMIPYTFLPMVKKEFSNQDIWIIFIFAIFLILIINIPLFVLVNKTKELNFYERHDIILGKAAGKAVSSLFVIFFVFAFVVYTMITLLFVKIYLLPDTPEWASLLFLVFPLTYASKKGPGTIGRLGTFIVPLIIMTIVFFFIMGINQMKPETLLPILSDSTLMSISKGAFMTAIRFAEILIIILFSYFLKKGETVNKAFIIGLLTFFISFMLILMPVILVLGTDLAKISNNPYYTYTRQVGDYEFVQRVQSINIVAWFTGTLVKLTIYNYMACYVIAGIFNNKKGHSFFAWPVTIISSAICMLPFMQKSSVHLIINDDIYPWVVLGYVFVIPLILMIAYLIRKKKVNEKIQQIIKEQQTQPQ